MKIYFSIIAAIFFAGSFAFAQDTTLLTRDAYKLTLAVDKESTFELDLPATPYIGPKNTVQIYPGEEVFIEVEQEAGAISKMIAVKKNLHPEKTLIISFNQVVKKKVCESSMLSIKNPFPYKLTYGAMILNVNKKWFETDVYPVEAGLFSYEVWPYAIVSIGMAKWSFQKN
jgi:hypothetical protein